jgi:hypothetical protein
VCPYHLSHLASEISVSSLSSLTDSLPHKTLVRRGTCRVSAGQMLKPLLSVLIVWLRVWEIGSIAHTFCTPVLWFIEMNMHLYLGDVPSSKAWRKPCVGSIVIPRAHFQWDDPVWLGPEKPVLGEISKWHFLSLWSQMPVTELLSILISVCQVPLTLSSRRYCGCQSLFSGKDGRDSGRSIWLHF